jgi:hypothetical protein
LIGTAQKTYDGTANATLTSANYQIAGFAFSEGATVNITAGAYDAGKNVQGPASAVTSGPISSGNYTFNSGTASSDYDITAITGIQAHGNIGQITPKALTGVSLVGSVTRQYNGNNSITNLTPANYSISGFISGEGASITSATGSYNNGKDVTANPAGSPVTSSVLTAGDYSANPGTSLSNYDLSAVTGVSATGNIGQITRLTSVSWVGGASGNWSVASNWAGGAIPDKNNVANVLLSGATVTFDNTVASLAGSVQVDSVSGGSLVVASGTLNTPSISTTSFTQTGGTITSSGNLSITASGTLKPGAITIPGAVTLSAGTLLGGGPIDASTGTFGSSSNVATLNLTSSFAGKSVVLTGSASSWTLCDAAGCGSSMAPPVFSKTSTSPIDIFFNGVNLGSSAATITSITGSIGANVAQIAAQALQDALDTDSVQKQIDYGFAGDVGTTPPMDHRIDATGISTPSCFEESRESAACK